EDDGCELLGERKLNQANLEEDDTEKELIEIVIPVGSTVIEQPVRDLDLAKKYHAVIFSIRRKDDISYSNLNDVRLRARDIILLKGYSTSFERLEYDQDCITIKKQDLKDYNEGKMVASVALLIGVIIVSVMGLLLIVT